MASNSIATVERFVAGACEAPDRVGATSPRRMTVVGILVALVDVCAVEVVPEVLASLRHKAVASVACAGVRRLRVDASSV